ncbi:MAG TPA: type II secretion system secretin GspD [Burkholderiaceae bacterium]|nr:type II secretion system secretin GspD [Burkholderiaceae bacterium]
MSLVQQLRRTSRRLARLGACALLLAGSALPPGTATAQAPQTSPAPADARATPRAGQPLTLNFKDADIDSVVGAFGHLLNKTFVIDPRVRGKITLETPRPVSPQAAYELLQSTLRLQGFAIVETGTLARVVPEADAKLQAGPVASGRAGQSGDGIVTQIFRLSYESASNLVPVLRPLISPNNTIVAYPNNNSLVITDYAANLQRIGRIIASLDTPASGEVEVVAMRHALAADVALQVSRLLDEQARTGGGQPGAAVDAGQRVSVLADTRINSILIRSPSPAKMNLAKGLIARLDQPSSEPGNIRVVYLRNAEATRLVQVLRGVLAGDGQGGAAGGGGAGGFGNPGGFGSGLQTGAFGAGAGAGAFGTSGPGGQAGGLGGPAGASPGTAPLSQSGPTPGVTTITAGGAIIAADPSTNSLIITAPEPVYRNLRAVIDKLDARRVQVYIESLIVEVSAERAQELGIQWQFLDRNNVLGGTNLPARGVGSNIIDATTNPAGIGRGLNIGIVAARPILGSGANALNLGLLARALETEAAANILATPNLVTLDNEEARIIIGQNVPFITGSFASTGATGGAVNPFQTIERRDVGTTLRVRPQVAEGGTVRMQIFQEVSSVQDASLAAGLITNKRAIESNVLVDDGQVVVLGGLIEERVEGGVSSVPGLGRVPLLGNLFRYDNRRRVKTNLLVFLRPVVLRSADASYGIAADRYDYIRQLRGDSRVTPSDLIPEREFQPTPMSPMPPRPDAPGVVPPSLAPTINDAMPERWRQVVPRTAPGEGGAGQAPAQPPADVRPGAPAEPAGEGPTIDLRPGAVPGQGLPPQFEPAAPGVGPAPRSALPPRDAAVVPDGLARRTAAPLGVDPLQRVQQTAPNEIVIPRRIGPPSGGGR